LPHAPQFPGLVLVSTHTPLHTVLEAPHAHLPALHACPGGQLPPQTPQFCALVMRSTQFWPHLLVPAPQLSVHTELEHTWGMGHALPHKPQLAPSLVRFTHAPLPHLT
jgi:hypothetical protein